MSTANETDASLADSIETLGNLLNRINQDITKASDQAKQLEQQMQELIVRLRRARRQGQSQKAHVSSLTRRLNVLQGFHNVYIQYMSRKTNILRYANHRMRQSLG